MNCVRCGNSNTNCIRGISTTIRTGLPNTYPLDFEYYCCWACWFEVTADTKYEYNPRTSKWIERDTLPLPFPQPQKKYPDEAPCPGCSRRLYFKPEDDQKVYTCFWCCGKFPVENVFSPESSNPKPSLYYQDSPFYKALKKKTP